MNFRKRLLECFRNGNHESYLRKLYKTLNFLSERLQRIKKELKLSNDNLTYYKIVKNIKQIEEDVKQLKEKDIKFMNESQFDKAMKKIIDIMGMLIETIEMLRDYIKKSELYTKHQTNNLPPFKTTSTTKDFSCDQSGSNLKPNCDSELELNEYKKKHNENESDDSKFHGDNEKSEDKESDESKSNEDNDNEDSKSNSGNEDSKSNDSNEDSKSNNGESNSDYYDPDKDYSYTEDSEESDITESDSYITPDFNSSGGCDCSNCDEHSEYSDYDEHSDYSDFEASSFYSDCECPSCRRRRFEEESEFMSESVNHDLYEYETPESYESDIMGKIHLKKVRMFINYFIEMNRFDKIKTLLIILL